MNGRERHLLVDTTSLVLTVVPHSADVPDRDGTCLVLTRLATAERVHLQHLWVDAGYQGAVVHALTEQYGWTVQVMRRPRRWCWVPPGADPAQASTRVQGLPRRWVVDRTFAWLGRWRRLSKGYEKLPETTEAKIYLAMNRIMLARLVAQ